MPSPKNKAIIACAGSGKTTLLVRSALAHRGGRVLITTYTRENVSNVMRFLVDEYGCIPPNVDVCSWYEFMFRDGVKPYQNYVSSTRIRNIYFERQDQKNRFRRADQYLTPSGAIYHEKASQFAVVANQKTSGRVVTRLERIYERILVDECQDLAGYDLEIMEALLRSRIGVTLVGDPRQATYSTNYAGKNRRYRGSRVYDWLVGLKEKGVLEIEESVESYRCRQEICAFADSIYPDLPATKSLNDRTLGDDGIGVVPATAVHSYLAKYTPMALKYNKLSKTAGVVAWNMGAVKGRTYDRVLIFPTKPMLDFLVKRDASQLGEKAKALFYVAVTRARYSVAFVLPEKGLKMDAPVARWGES